MEFVGEATEVSVDTFLEDSGGTTEDEVLPVRGVGVHEIGLPMSVVIDSHVLIGELNNQFGKGGPALKMLEEVKIGVSLSDLTFDVGGQCLLGVLDGVLHLVSIDIFPLGVKEAIQLKVGFVNLLPEFLDDVDVLVDILKGLLGSLNGVRETEHLGVVLEFLKVVLVFFDLSSGLFAGFESLYTSSDVLVVVFGPETLLESFLIFFKLIDNFLSLFSLDVNEGSDLLLDSQTDLKQTLLVFLQVLGPLDLFAF